MKIRNHILALMASAAIFASCNEAKDGPDITPPEPTETVPVKISFDKSTFTKSDFPSAESTEKETWIYNYAILVFNSQQVLEHIELKTYYSKSAGTDAVKFSDIDSPDEFEVSVGTKYFFVVMNVPVGDLLDEQNNMDPNNNILFEGKTDYILKMNALDLIVENMKSGLQANSNQDNRGFMMTTLETMQKETISKRTDNSPNPVKLTVGHAVAKVSVADALDPTSQMRGLLTKIQYKVGNNPNSMYVIPRFHQGNEDVFITPNHNDSKVFPDHYMGDLEDYQAASKSGAHTWTYCMENSNLTPKRGNSSVVRIKGVYKPHVLYIKTASGDEVDTRTFNEGDDFYRVRVKQKDPDGNYVYETEYYSEDPTSFIDGTTHEVVPYPGGVCYYRLWLKNPAHSGSLAYAVKRNSYYKVSIKTVIDAGEPDDEDDDDDDKEIPLEDQALIHATIKIADWDDIDQDGNL